jgi:hypothetical protein
MVDSERDVRGMIAVGSFISIAIRHVGVPGKVILNVTLF